MCGCFKNIDEEGPSSYGTIITSIQLAQHASKETSVIKYRDEESISGHK